MNAIKVEGLYKTYDNFTLKNINFEIKPGEVIGLIGENGAGKSTILRQMLNIGKKEKGSIYYFVKIFTKMKRKSRKISELYLTSVCCRICLRGRCRLFYEGYL